MRAGPEPALGGRRGLGWHPIKRDSTPLDILAGVNYTNENYPQIAPVSAPPEVQHESSTNLSTDFFEDFQSTSDYRATFDFAR